MLMKRFCFYLFIVISLLGCVETKDKGFVFKLPVVINSQFTENDSSFAFNADHVESVFPVFAGKYAFADTIDISPWKIDSSRSDNYSRRVDTSLDYSAMDVNGFELLVDYNATVKYNEFFCCGPPFMEYYPVYFVNTTSSNKIFLGKDGYVFGIQEAYNAPKYGEWKPIEGRGFDFCGNGHWRLAVKPGEFVVVLMRKYEGEFTTGLRVRVKQGESIYVSKPYEGVVNKKQFNIKDSSYFHQRLIETNGNAANWLFYGAVPEEEEWAVKSF